MGQKEYTARFVADFQLEQTAAFTFDANVNSEI